MGKGTNKVGQTRALYKMIGGGMVILLIAWMAFGLLGAHVITAMYEGRTIGFLNDIIAGQQIHTADHYVGAAQESLVYVTILALAVFLFFIFMSTMKQYFPNVFAVLFGILVTVGLILTVEGTLRLIGQSQKAWKRTYPENYHSSFYFGVRKPLPGDHSVQQHATGTGEPIFDVTYSIDQYSRRVTPVDDRENRDKFLLFFGGSFTYGDGIHNNETIPFSVGQLAKDHMPYNYGYEGLGPLDMLAKAENINFKQEVKESQGTVVYTFIDDHINRAIGSMSVMSFMSDGAYYKLNDNGKLSHEGTFKTGRPVVTSIYRLLDKSRILKALNIGIPPRHTKQHYMLTAKAIEQTKERIKKIYPESNFYVLLFPGEKLGEKLKGYLEERQIVYLDYINLYDVEDPRYTLSPIDGHPTAFANQAVARQMVKDLGITQEKDQPLVKK